MAKIKYKIMKRHLIFLLLFCIGAFELLAQPTTFNYQAVVRDINGNLITDQQILLRLSIIDTDETIYYEEEHQTSTNEFGQIELEVGDGTLISGDFESIPWESAQLLLNVDMSMDEGNTFTNLGQSPLLGVPYAFYSASGEPGPEGPAGNGIETVEDNGDGTLTFHFTDGSTYITPNLAGPTLEDQPGNLIYHDSAGWVGTDAIKIAGSNVAIGTNPAISRLLVHGDTNASEDDPIFEVKNKNGNVVFAVYQTGVEVNVDETTSGKGLKGGFAVGGLTGGKDSIVQYFRVTPDSVRVYLREDTTKAQKGGFAVGGLTSGKRTTEYLRVTRDSTRVYVDNSTKAQKGGFAVGGLTGGKNKATGNEYLHISQDSVRIYIDQSSTKAQKGGFAVGGLTWGKGVTEYLRVTGDSTRVYVNNSAKGLKGGFAVGGLTGGKSGTNFLDLTPDNYFIGHQAGANNTTGTKNSFIGYQSGVKNDSGMNNIFIGEKSGYNNINGYSNIFIGNQSGYYNIGGDYWEYGSRNIFIGVDAGLANTIGGNNIFIGQKAGFLADTGMANIFIGQRSGKNNRANSNIFFGSLAGEDNTYGEMNLFFGNQSGQKNTTGSGNMFLGYLSGVSNIDGSDNVYVGIYTGSNRENTSNNTMIGSGAGRYKTTGQNNVYLGFNAGRSAEGNNCVFIGSNVGAEELNDNRLYIDNQHTPAPLIYGEFDNDLLKFNGQVVVRDFLKVGNGTQSSIDGAYDVFVTDDLEVDDNLYVNN